ncbi:hypothetical protein [Acidihalobacter prosperus]
MPSDIDTSTPLDFETLYRGRSFGILRWSQLDTFWERLKSLAEKGWYIYAIGDPPPVEVSASEMLVRFIDEIDDLLHREHDHDYCGIVYADDFENPHLVKIFDPNHLGSSCGSSGNPTPPGWVISRAPPVDLTDAMPMANNRRRWWHGLFKR